MHKEIKLTDFFIIRTPRLSTAVWEVINAQNTAKSFWEQASKLIADEELLDAITIASQDFSERLNEVLSEPYTDKTKKLLPTLYKYISRMANRPTPFGKFSSISIGEITNHQTNIVLSDSFLAKYRLDLATQEGINQQLLKQSGIIEKVKFYANTSISYSDDSFTFIEYAQQKGERTYNWSKINSNRLIKSMLRDAEGGRCFKGMLKTLTDMGISENKSQKFIYELIDLKLLIPTTEPITTKDTDYLLDQAINLATKSELEPKVKKIAHVLKRVRKESMTIHDALKKIDYTGILPEKPKNVFQVDTSRGCINHLLNKSDVQKLTEDLRDLRALSKIEMPVDLQNFCEKFTARYADQEIPLMEALDTVNGIGYGSQTKFIDKNNPLLFEMDALSKNEIRSSRLMLQGSIIEKYLNKIEFGQKTIVLQREDLKQKAGTEEHKIPFGFYVVGNLLKTKAIGNEQQNFRFHLTACGGVSSLPLLTRFSYLDPTLESQLKQLASAEEINAASAILAEIVFLPNSRAGNILTRPSLYRYEIPIIGQSSLDREHTILLSDLLVKVQGNKIYLRSKRLDKIVLPRLSSAHNFHYGMSVYRFLCDLQFQDNPLNISWDWGEAAKRVFLPRVVYKNIILSRAQWNIGTDVLKSLIFKDNNEKIQFIRAQFNLPKRVAISQGDHEMYLDLDHELGQEILLKELNKQNIKLTENLYDHFDSHVLDSRGGKYANEILIPFQGQPSLDAKVSNYNFSKDIVRTFIPGSEWLYLKIYCGEKQGDSFIRDYLKDIIKDLISQDLIEKWFFIRYYDPDHHLRIRFHLKGDYQISFYQINKYLLEHFNLLVCQKKISRVVFDTYERELERYGPGNIENCESIFSLESNLIIDLLQIIKQRGEHLRWKFALSMVNILFDAFGMDGKQKTNLLALLRNNFLHEFDAYSNVKYTMDQKYRAIREEVSDLMENMTSIHPDVRNVLEKYETQIFLLAAKCRDNGDFRTKPNEIVASLSHMLINRIFYSYNREQEMVIYHFLYKNLIRHLKTKVSVDKSSKLFSGQS